MLKEGEPTRGAVILGPGDVRVEERDEPQIVEPTDAMIRVSAACVCGSDLWPYRETPSSRRRASSAYRLTTTPSATLVAPDGLVAAGASE